MNTFYDAFISYGRADSLGFGRKLYARLLEVGFKVWFDQNDIPLGVDFQNQIDDGIEKALTGDKPGAIEDFQAVIKSTGWGEEWKKQRQGWIDALKASKNPFTPEVIEKLK